MDDDAHFMIDDGDDDTIEAPPDPCPRCGRNHVAIFFGERHRTFEIHGAAGLAGSFFNQSMARVHMRTCMDCGYIELYREEMMKQDD